MLNPFNTIFYLFKDIFKYIRYKRWREYKNYGTLTILTGLFGKGKTLMLTKIVRQIYKRYNNRKVYDFKDKCWKMQHIYIVSNVKLNEIPYIELHNLNDMIIYSDPQYNDGVSVWIFCVDEMSTQINSREYKTNFSTELLNILLTCRHYRFKIIGTSQRFNHVDALVRQVTQTSSECDKIWRLCKVIEYDAWTIENTSDLTKVKPRNTKCYFIKDSDYLAYDTSAVVNNFKDNVKNGNILSDAEILQYQQAIADTVSPLSLKRRYRKKLNK
jgi:hypothetical protein